MTERPRVLIPASSFMMGSHDGADNERPLHRVVVSAFEIAVCQVTNSEWSRFMEAGAHPPPPCWNDPNFNDPEQPVVAVSWLDAVSYCEWLSALTARRFRLPTEAEWECAARGGIEGTRYPWGDDTPTDDARWAKGPERVARAAPNGYGLYDVCTNVHEWCSDWYAADYYAVSPPRDPRGPAEGTRRVSRGGSWRHQIKVSRCAARSSIPPTFRYADYGFRIACDPS
jgi:sulfatase modifying factor 1